MYSVRSLQCFTRLPGSLVSSVLLSIPTSLDVLVVLTTIIFNLRKCSLTTPGGANKASLIQYSRQAPKTTKDVKINQSYEGKKVDDDSLAKYKRKMDIEEIHQFIPMASLGGGKSSFSQVSNLPLG